jgi:hypothetical protein
MLEFIFTHRFPRDFKGSPATAASAKAYFEEIGENVVSRSDLMFETRKLGDCGNGTEPNAYTIVRAEDAEAAMAMARKWNLLQHGGGLEVRQLTAESIQFDALTRAQTEA